MDYHDQELTGDGGRIIDLVFQSKRIARRRNTNVVAIAKMADGSRGAWKTRRIA